jgi:cell division protein FtsL
MANVNYSETVIVPLLQKKCQDLMNINLVLEANFLVEQRKCFDLQTKIAELEAKLAKQEKKQSIKKNAPVIDGESY